MTRKDDLQDDLEELKDDDDTKVVGEVIWPGGDDHDLDDDQDVIVVDFTEVDT